MSPRMITVDVAPWRAVWRGGRLADVFHVEFSTPVSCFEVGGWSWETSSAGGTRLDVERGLSEWIAECGADHLRELPYL
jgi:hypothetical protein